MSSIVARIDRFTEALTEKLLTYATGRAMTFRDQAAIKYIAAENEPIEGAAGVALAGLLQRKDAVAGRKVAIIICGGNVSQQTLDQIQAQ